MEGKKRYIAVAVTTQEALEKCFAEPIVLFCIENPLYSSLRDSIRNRMESADYDIEEYPEKEVMLFKKIRGTIRFDDEKYEAFYLPLS